MELKPKEKKFYGGATVGEKGQVVLPAELRHDLKIETGEKLAVLVLKRDNFQGILMVKSEMLTTIMEKFLGGELEGLV